MSNDIKQRAVITKQGSSVEEITGEALTQLQKDNEKHNEIALNHAANAYQRDRANGKFELDENNKPVRVTEGYPSIGDQLDMIFKSGVLDGSDWAAAIQAVKDAHPKPDAE